jgi:hypothetical protein
LLKLKPDEIFVVSWLVLKIREGMEQSLVFSGVSPDGISVEPISGVGVTDCTDCGFPGSFWFMIQPAMQQMSTRRMTEAQMNNSFMILPSLCISSA